ncbi:MAG: acyl-CoA carboxylase subunit beta [Desulfobacteraceae bacterium]|nr:MAG: acyl-CoA carboxylase subunit beta [Desulfobacteraceae bacterium]
MPSSVDDFVDNLRRRKEHIKKGGALSVQKKPHQVGMLTARERLEAILDPDTFVETDLFVTHHCVSADMEGKEVPAEGIITGYGEIDARPVYVYSYDFSAGGGALGRWGARKLCKIMDLAYQKRCPIIGINHSSGARFQELLRGDGGSGTGFGEQFYRIALYSGVIPQISLFLGTNSGGGVYGPGMSDVVIATKQSNMFISGPGPVESVLGEKVTPEELGSARMHATVSGAVHVLADDDMDALNKCRELLAYLPLNNHDEAPIKDTGDNAQRLCPQLNEVVPMEPRKIYDMHEVIQLIVDHGDFFEIHRDYVKNIIVGFGRFSGQSVGIVASNPQYLAGAVTESAARKAARFIRFSDLFNIPIVYLVDSPAFMVGKDQERAGILSRGTTFLFATAEATVPKITVIIRKSIAASMLAMGSLALGADIVFAWPMADLVALDPEALAKIIYSRELREAQDPESLLRKRTEDAKKEIGDIYASASWQNVNDIIEPAETRLAIIRALKMTKGKIIHRPQKKYSNIPL